MSLSLTIKGTANGRTRSDSKFAIVSYGSLSQVPPLSTVSISISMLLAIGSHRRCNFIAVRGPDGSSPSGREPYFRGTPFLFRFSPIIPSE